MERRRRSQNGQSPTTVLDEVPARVVLERMPVPVLAIVGDGSIVFANAAFADMLGYTPDAVMSLEFAQIFHALPVDASPVSVVHGSANQIVALMHADGSVVKARMSKSALLREHDPLALATFDDLTEQLWARGH